MSKTRLILRSEGSPNKGMVELPDGTKLPYVHMELVHGPDQFPQLNLTVLVEEIDIDLDVAEAILTPVHPDSFVDKELTQYRDLVGGFIYTVHAEEERG